MRIVTGKYKGRTLFSPQWETTRPMTDKVRGAVFNILGEIVGSRVLDLYAGTGAVGLEALSRGAGEAWFVDADRRCVDLITRNAEKLGVNEPTRVFNQQVETFFEHPSGHLPPQFDLVFFTPPYAIFDFETLGRVVPFLAENATVVAEKDTYRDREPPLLPGLALWDQRHYGGTEMLFYVKV